jgi:SAM-dependent methyltransferase
VPTPPATDFDEYSDDYRGAVEESIAFAGASLDFFIQAKVETLLELAAAEVGDPRSRAFLDVGCGPGDTDRLLEGRVGRLAGIDVSPRMVERARRLNPWAEYRSIDAGEPIPFEDASFDVCFAICVLHHVPPAERAELIREMKRTCRPGGVIALFEHNPFNPLTRRAVSNCEFDRDAELLTRRQATRLLREQGLGEPEGRYIVFFTRRSRLLRGIERRLGWLPLGAQYAVVAQRP